MGKRFMYTQDLILMSMQHMKKIFPWASFLATVFLLLIFFHVNPVQAEAKEELRRTDLEKTAQNLTVIEKSTFVTPEMFGAAGDGVTDDTLALQSALDSGYPLLLPPKKYLIQSTLVISGKTSISDAGSVIIYTGKDCAIRLTAINNHCDISFGGIRALAGSGIEFYCNSRETRCQYVNLSFNTINAADKCIFFNRDGDGNMQENGWLNEIRINNGCFSSGQYGVYADAKGFNGINNIKLLNVAFEGVIVGAHLANGCRAWTFINTRVAEMTEDYHLTFETVGNVSGLTIIMGDRFNLDKTSFSPETQGAVITSVVGTDYRGKKAAIGYFGEIVNGTVYTENQSMMSYTSFTEIDKSSDLNSILQPGNYSCTKSTTAKSLLNVPTDTAFTMLVYYANGTPDFICQEVKAAYTNNVYKRTYSVGTGSFSEWKRSLNEDDLEALQKEVEELRSLVNELANK